MAPAAGHTPVVDQLRRAIIDGTLLPNERLVELELAERYKVSRAAVRAALLELAKERLVERPQNRGARVRAVSLEEAVEVLEARQAVEGLCAAKAAERATSAEINELERIIADMRTAVEAAELNRYSDLNRTLHQCIRDACRHATAVGIVDGLRNQTVRHQYRVAFLPGRPAVSLSEHEAIVEAIAAREPAEAEQAMRAHLDSVIKAITHDPPTGLWF